MCLFLCSLCMGVCVHVEAKVNIRYLALSVLHLPSRNLQVCQVKLHGQLQVALLVPPTPAETGCPKAALEGIAGGSVSPCKFTKLTFWVLQPLSFRHKCRRCSLQKNWLWVFCSHISRSSSFSDSHLSQEHKAWVRVCSSFFRCCEFPAVQPCL